MTFTPAGLNGYQELMASCSMIPVEVDGETINVPCAHPADIWHSKMAADRPKDQDSLPLLYAQLDTATQERIQRTQNPSTSESDKSL